MRAVDKSKLDDGEGCLLLDFQVNLLTQNQFIQLPRVTLLLLVIIHENLHKLIIITFDRKGRTNGQNVWIIFEKLILHLIFSFDSENIVG